MLDKSGKFTKSERFGLARTWEVEWRRRSRRNQCRRLRGNKHRFGLMLM